MAEYYRFFVKNSPFDTPFNTTKENYNAGSYGDVFKQYYPLTSSISVDFFPDLNDLSASQYSNYDSDRKKLKVLQPLFKKYQKYSSYFNYITDYFNFNTSSICLVNIPRVFYGDSISKGSVKLSIFKDGILLSKAEDIKRNGELVITTNTGTVDGETPATDVAGIVLYDEGVIALFNNSELDNYTEQFYGTNPSSQPDYPRWINWGLAAKVLTNSIITSSYDIEFDGIQKIPQITMLAHAPRGELNSTTNYTFLNVSQYNTQTQNQVRYVTSSFSVQENNNLAIKNITKNQYITPSASFHKETYITTINLYDEDKKIIGVAKLATPVRKSEQRDYTFKLKLDL